MNSAGPQIFSREILRTCGYIIQIKWNALLFIAWGNDAV